MADLARSRTIYRDYAEAVWHKRDVAATDRFFTPDFVDHSAPPEQGPGLEGLKATFAMFLDAFPDARITLHDEITEGDRLVCRITFEGAHCGGPFFGIPATGRPVTVSQIHIFRIAGNRFAEHWSNSDDLGMLRQLGVIPGQTPIDA